MRNKAHQIYPKYAKGKDVYFNPRSHDVVDFRIIPDGTPIYLETRDGKKISGIYVSNNDSISILNNEEGYHTTYFSGEKMYKKYPKYKYVLDFSSVEYLIKYLRYLEIHTNPEYDYLLKILGGSDNYPNPFINKKEFMAGECATIKKTDLLRILNYMDGLKD